MAYTTEEERYQTLILLELGENFNDSSSIAPNIGKIWDLFTDKGPAGGGTVRVQYLYAKRQSIDIMLGSTWKGQYHQVGVKNDSLDDKLATLRAMRQTVQDEIEGSFSIGFINLDYNEPGLE